LAGIGVALVVVTRRRRARPDGAPH
jgi:hypothetical protein